MGRGQSSEPYSLVQERLTDPLHPAGGNAEALRIPVHGGYPRADLFPHLFVDRMPGRGSSGDEMGPPKPPPRPLVETDHENRDTAPSAAAAGPRGNVGLVPAHGGMGLWLSQTRGLADQEKYQLSQLAADSCTSGPARCDDSRSATGLCPVARDLWRKHRGDLEGAESYDPGEYGNLCAPQSGACQSRVAQTSGAPLGGWQCQRHGARGACAPSRHASQCYASRISAHAGDPGHGVGTIAQGGAGRNGRDRGHRL